MNLKLIGYLLRRNYIQIGIVILVAAFAINRFVKSGDPFADQWGLWLEAVITFSIVGMTILIWYNEQRQDWENSLPKKLNIAYMLGKEKVYCRVLNAPLASESDIRTWATSIAGTILNKKVFFNFSGFFMEKPRVNKKKGMMIYYLDIFIDEPIKGISEGDDIVFFDNGLLDKSSFTVPEENDKDQP
jgi:hypothetical protein